MIRIIGGIYKGRFLKVPDSRYTRPTMDKVRQALFNALKDKSLGSVTLDLFAGSGAMGLEALSRGASKVYLNDKERETFALMRENALGLCPDKEKVILSCQDYRLFLKRNTALKFDLVILDPPYRFTINNDIIQYLAKENMLNPNAVIISEQDYPNKEIEGFEMKEYRYGEKHVALYRKESV
ncbi:MAG: 16S rRNA (guanine(966)-N(2))-methyltransferase RsmD [Bacilli bacterium]|jgi:16S rRNA (guanine966-N2)-methyltransferase|nr:16S rRNA (guanine(966)-N(2))-methyltransferase RsmD [Bacilli bacterium]